jgi:hypothetical protein
VVTPRLVKPTPMAVPQPFADPQAVEESLKQQVGPPPYPNAQGEALRGNFVPAPAPMSPSSQAPATPAAESSAMGEGAKAEPHSVTAQAAVPHSASADDTLVPQADTPQTETPHAERPDTDAPSAEATPVSGAEERAEAQPQNMVVAQAVSIAGADGAPWASPRSQVALLRALRFEAASASMSGGDISPKQERRIPLRVNRGSLAEADEPDGSVTP